MGCLAILWRLLVLGTAVIAAVLFIYFGPPNWFVGLLVGLGGTFVLTSLLGAPGWVTNGLTRQRKAFPADEPGDFGDRQRLRWRVSEGARWLLTLSCAVPAALTIAISVAYAFGHANVDAPQGLGLLVGFLSIMAAFAWLGFGE